MGSVGVLLRVEHPHQQVGVLDDPVDLQVVRYLRRVVIGQVEQHQALQVGILSRGVEQARAGHLVAFRDADPRQDLAGVLWPPGARQRPGGGGALDADSCQVQAGEPVEQR
jgi:hypothetical protein